MRLKIRMLTRLCEFYEFLVNKILTQFIRSCLDYSNSERRIKITQKVEVRIIKLSL